MNKRTSSLSRRGFMGAAAASLGALGMSSQTPASVSWKMRLSTSTIQFSRLPVEEALQRIAGLGFEAVDIWSAHAGCPHLDDVLDRVGPEKLKALLAENNLKLFAFSVYTGGYERYAELLGKSGGGLAIHGSAARDESKSLSAQMKEYLESLKPEIELAEQYNSYIAIENHGGKPLLNSMDSLKAFVDTNTSPRIGIALAPLHLQRNEASVPEAIRICGKQLFFFYAWQDAEGTQQLPGVGPADMKPWLQALADIGYKGYVNPFMHHEPEPDVMCEALKQAKQYLERCYREL